MATIEIMGNTLSCAIGIGSFAEIGSSFTNAISDARDLKTVFSSLRSKIEDAAAAVDTSSDSSLVSRAEDIEDDKESNLTLAYDKLEEFIEDVGNVDEEVSDEIEARKEEFYAEYEYLKPECEKSLGEKFCEWVSDVWDWCKEHYVAIITAIVVIAIAIIAVVCFGIELLVVAAIASLIGLIIGIVDILFLIFTGNDVAGFLRSKGFNVLADIFSGFSFACDFIAIVFPVASLVKNSAKFISKFGIKAFVKSTGKSVVMSLKDTFNKLFRSGFKDGLKNAFKIFVFDFDDLKGIGKEVFDPKNSAQWILGENGLIPDPSSKNYLACMEALDNWGLDCLPVDSFGNLDFDELSRLTIGNTLPDGTPTSFAIPDFSADRGTKRGFDFGNMGQANNMLFDQTGLTIGDVENGVREYLSGTMGVDNLSNLDFRVTWHDNIDMSHMNLIPSIFHDGSAAQYTHSGGIQLVQFMMPQTSNWLNNVIRTKAPDVIANIPDYISNISIPSINIPLPAGH